MALIPPFYLDCVVALGKRDTDGNAHWTASGFLFWEFERVVSDDVKQYHVCLVTNRHVLPGAAKLLMRFDPKRTDPAGESEGSLLKVDGSPTWHGHPDPQIDVAVLPLTISRLQEMGIRTEWFRSDEHPMPVGLSEGPDDGP